MKVKGLGIFLLTTFCEIRCKFYCWSRPEQLFTFVLYVAAKDFLKISAQEKILALTWRQNTKTVLTEKWLQFAVL